MICAQYTILIKNILGNWQNLSSAALENLANSVRACIKHILYTFYDTITRLYKTEFSYHQMYLILVSNFDRLGLYIFSTRNCLLFTH